MTIKKKPWSCPGCNNTHPPKGYVCEICKMRFDSNYIPIEPLHPSQHMGDEDFEGRKDAS